MTTTGDLRPGLIGEVAIAVSEDLTAAAYRNEGVDVLATPVVVWLVEAASVKALETALGPGQATVGTQVDLRHIAATPVGMRVTARSRVEAVDGRRIVFHADVWDGVEKIAAAGHERFVVDLERFLARAGAKKPAE